MTRFMDVRKQPELCIVFNSGPKRRVDELTRIQNS